MGYKNLLTPAAAALLIISIAVTLVSSDEYDKDELVIGTSQISNYRDSTHNLKLGKRERGEILLYSKYVSARRVPSEVISQNITYPPNSTNIKFSRKIDGPTISCIDVRSIGRLTAGYPSLIEGGIDHKNVTINLTSQKDRGYRFLVRIFGKINKLNVISV